MKLLLDTNIVLDYLGVNIGFSEEAKDVIQCAIVEDAIEIISASQVTDIYYVAKKRLNAEKALELLEGLQTYIKIVPVTDIEINKAIQRRWKDFEDAVQYSVAETNNVDIIITRNGKDFEENTIPCMTPKEFLEYYEAI